jgi:beta-glucanase (GH16 family)
MMSAQREGMLSSFFTYNDMIPFDSQKWNEIDIEILGRYADDVQFNTITPGQTNHVGRRQTPFNPHLGFHTYAIEWTPSYVAWFIDGSEAYRQTGPHIQTLIYPQKIMMNIWIPTAPNWAGEWNDNVLPAFASYDYVSYSSYTRDSGSVGTNNDFTPQWNDDFNTVDSTRWDQATHTWSDNQCDFTPANIVFNSGKMILCLTKETSVGYVDAVAPYVSSARADADGVVINFSEEVDSVSAATTSNYLIPGKTILQVDLYSDKKTVKLTIEGYDTSTISNVILMNIKDRAVPPNTISAKSVTVTKGQPLSFPIKINCGGPAYKEYLPDQQWVGNTFEYGHLDGWSGQNSSNVSGAADPIVFQTELDAAAEYRIRVPNGNYLVYLLMSENYFTAAGKRIFDISVQGNVVDKNLDLFARVGRGAQYQRVVPNVKVTEGIIDIHFMSLLDNALINAIMVVRLGTGINENRGSSSQQWNIGQNYPNPFNGNTIIPFSLAGDDEVTIDFFDTLGRRVNHHPLGMMQSGSHYFRWNAKSSSGLSLATGAYYYVVQGKYNSSTRKLMLLQ